MNIQDQIEAIKAWNPHINDPGDYMDIWGNHAVSPEFDSQDDIFAHGIPGAEDASPFTSPADVEKFRSALRDEREKERLRKKPKNRTALTRDFRETVRERVESDLTFRQALLRQLDEERVRSERLKKWKAEREKEEKARTLKLWPVPIEKIQKYLSERFDKHRVIVRPHNMTIDGPLPKGGRGVIIFKLFGIPCPSVTEHIMPMDEAGLVSFADKWRTRLGYSTED